MKLEYLFPTWRLNRKQLHRQKFGTVSVVPVFVEPDSNIPFCGSISDKLRQWISKSAGYLMDRMDGLDHQGHDLPALCPNCLRFNNMETLEIAVALIRNADCNRWLTKINPVHSTAEFLIARRLEKELLRETVTREIAWDLNLDRSQDFIVSSMAQINSNFEAALPGQDGLCRILCSFYNVQLYGKNIVQQIDRLPDRMWLDSEEICDGETRSGLALDPLFLLLNGHANIIQRWESQSFE